MLYLQFAKRRRCQETILAQKNSKEDKGTVWHDQPAQFRFGLPENGEKQQH